MAKSERCKHASYNGCRSEQHRKKQKAAAKKYRRKKPIFTIAQPIAQYADEPQEGEPSEGHQVQRQCDPVCACFKPISRFQRIRWHGNPQQPKYRQKQDTE